ncbi:MAG: hypothetical protein C4538_04860 [Nitrospiraceae bacterium]|nr:MAG: hypothetical protein C4538_04860 [Nitrospiraceae bacterium]
MKSKKSIIIIGAIVVIIIGALIIMLTSLNRIVAAAIEKYGSLVTQTRVSVSSVNIDLSAGEGSVSGLTVGNPSGFTGPSAFHLGSISTKIDTGSITKDMVIVDNVTISGPHIMYEIDGSGRSNIEIIKQNVQQFQDKGTSGKTETQNEDAGKGVNLQVRKLLIENGEIDVRIAALSDKVLSANLPRIELSNIGGKNGASPGEVSAQILSALTKEAGSAASKLGVDMYLGKTLDEVTKGIAKGGDLLKETAKGAGETVKKLFRK